jgi:hypothetical protein
VPRYFFHFSDGKRRFTDTGGYELSGIAAARTHATNNVRDLKAAMCDPGIQDLSGWSMTVLDADGQTVFEIGFDMKPRATRTENITR